MCNDCFAQLRRERANLILQNRGARVEVDMNFNSRIPVTMPVDFARFKKLLTVVLDGLVRRSRTVAGREDFRHLERDLLVIEICNKIRRWITAPKCPDRTNTQDRKQQSRDPFLFDFLGDLRHGTIVTYGLGLTPWLSSKVQRSEQHFGRSKRARSAGVPHGIPTLFPPRNRRRIFAAKQTRGTQDVNDPSSR
jgi:hypothetical protein